MVRNGTRGKKNEGKQDSKKIKVSEINHTRFSRPATMNSSENESFGRDG